MSGGQLKVSWKTQGQWLIGYRKRFRTTAWMLDSKRGKPRQERLRGRDPQLLCMKSAQNSADVAPEPRIDGHSPTTGV